MKLISVPKPLTQADIINELNKEQEYNIVDNPQHYCSGEHECIDVMESLFGIQAVNVIYLNTDSDQISKMEMRILVKLNGMSQNLWSF